MFSLWRCSNILSVDPVGDKVVALLRRKAILLTVRLGRFNNTFPGVPEVDVFALFLEERLDSEDLDFLGYVLEGALEVHACVDAPCFPLPLLALTTCLLPSD